MKELVEIIQAMERLRATGGRGALASIVRATGSTYRREGAKMLITEDGEMIGSISGGCLEGDVFEVAQGVMQSGQPRLKHYDLTSDDDRVWGLGLGCNGTVDVFIEPLP